MSTEMNTLQFGNLWLNDIGRLFDNDFMSDVILIFGEKRFHGHKVILALCSERFRSVFLEESSAEITIDEEYTDAFDAILKFAYTGQINLTASIEGALEILILASKYKFTDLEKSIVEFLKERLTISNFLLVYKTAHSKLIQAMKDACFNFSDKYAKSVLMGQGFENLKLATLLDLITRQAFAPFQVEMYFAVRKWIHSNGKDDPIPILDVFCLAKIPLKFLLNVVRRDGFFKSDDILDAVAEIQGISKEPENQSASDSPADENMEMSRSLGPLDHGTPSQESGMVSAMSPQNDQEHPDTPGGNTSIGNMTGQGQISIKMATGEVFELEVNSATTIQSIREMIEEKMGVSKTLLTIYRNGVGNLNSNRTIGGCRVKFGETLKCNIRKQRQSGEID